MNEVGNKKTGNLNRKNTITKTRYNKKNKKNSVNIESKT